MKKCYSCQSEKSITEYYKDRSRPDGVSSRCIACDKEKRRKAYQRNSERERAGNSLWKKLNPSRHCEINCRWSKNNPEYLSNRHKIRNESDSLYKFKRAIRRSTLRCFSYVTDKKRRQCESYLGTTWEEAKRHIESQFTDGMSWDNQGEWHIDHIEPLANAKTEADVVRLSHYTNLQPLWAKDNMRKGAK